MKKNIFVLFLSLVSVLSVFSQTKRQDIIKLLEITETKSQAIQMFDLMMPSLESIAPGVPAVFWKTFREKIDMDNFVDLHIPIYDRHFTHDDIKGLIQFYQSPLGKKLIAVTPSLTQESYQIGEKWGEQLAMDVINELMKSGYY